MKELKNMESTISKNLDQTFNNEKLLKDILSTNQDTNSEIKRNTNVIKGNFRVQEVLAEKKSDENPITGKSKTEELLEQLVEINRNLLNIKKYEKGIVNDSGITQDAVFKNSGNRSSSNNNSNDSLSNELEMLSAIRLNTSNIYNILEFEIIGALKAIRFANSDARTVVNALNEEMVDENDAMPKAAEKSKGLWKRRISEYFSKIQAEVLEADVASVLNKDSERSSLGKRIMASIGKKINKKEVVEVDQGLQYETSQWTTKDSLALTQVIPSWLSKIYSALTGKTEIYDYRTGLFREGKEVFDQESKFIERDLLEKQRRLQDLSETAFGSKKYLEALDEEEKARKEYWKKLNSAEMQTINSVGNNAVSNMKSRSLDAQGALFNNREMMSEKDIKENFGNFRTGIESLLTGNIGDSFTKATKRATENYAIDSNTADFSRLAVEGSFTDKMMSISNLFNKKRQSKLLLDEDNAAEILNLMRFNSGDDTLSSNLRSYIPEIDRHPEKPETGELAKASMQVDGLISTEFKKPWLELIYENTLRMLDVMGGENSNDGKSFLQQRKDDELKAESEKATIESLNIQKQLIEATTANADLIKEGHENTENALDSQTKTLDEIKKQGQPKTFMEKFKKPMLIIGGLLLTPFSKIIDTVKSFFGESEDDGEGSVLGRMIKRSLSFVVSSLFEAVKFLGGLALDGIKWGFTKLWDSKGEIFDAIKSAFMWVGKFAFNTIKDLTFWLLDNVKENIKMIGGLFGSLGSFIFDKIKGAFGYVGESIVKTLTAMSDVIMYIPNKIWDGLKWVGGGIVDAVSYPFKKIGEFVSGLSGTVGEIFTGVGDTIASGISGITESIMSIPNTIWEGLKWAGGKLIEFITKPFEKIASFLGIGDKAKEVVGEAAAVTGNAVKSIIPGVNGVDAYRNAGDILGEEETTFAQRTGTALIGQVGGLLTLGQSDIKDDKSALNMIARTATTGKLTDEQIVLLAQKAQESWTYKPILAAYLARNGKDAVEKAKARMDALIQESVETVQTVSTEIHEKAHSVKNVDKVNKVEYPMYTTFLTKELVPILKANSTDDVTTKQLIHEAGRIEQMYGKDPVKLIAEREKLLEVARNSTTIDVTEGMEKSKFQKLSEFTGSITSAVVDRWNGEHLKDNVDANQDVEVKPFHMWIHDDMMSIIKSSNINPTDLDGIINSTLKPIENAYTNGDITATELLKAREDFKSVLTKESQDFSSSESSSGVNTSFASRALKKISSFVKMEKEVKPFEEWVKSDLIPVLNSQNLSSSEVQMMISEAQQLERQNLSSTELLKAREDFKSVLTKQEPISTTSLQVKESKIRTEDISHNLSSTVDLQDKSNNVIATRLDKLINLMTRTADNTDPKNIKPAIVNLEIENNNSENGGTISNTYTSESSSPSKLILNNNRSSSSFSRNPMNNFSNDYQELRPSDAALLEASH